MILGKRLINTGVEAACLTDDVNPFTGEVADGGVALYSLDYDASDAGGLYDGTPTNVEFGVGGQINYGARFNGSSSRIDTGYTPPTGSDNFSVSCWLNWSGASNDGVWSTFTNSGTDRKGIGVQVLSTGQINCLAYDSAGPDSIAANSPSAISTGQWYHVVVTYEGGLIKLYINKTLQSTTINQSITGHHATLRLGQYYANLTNANMFEGDLDQVRIFSKALSSDEVSTLYAETACVYDCTTDTVNYPSLTTPVAYYKLDNSAEDETGNYDGTETDIEYRFGRFGQAAVFNGSSSYIDLGSIILGGTNNVTVSMWVNPASSQTAYATIFDDEHETIGGFVIHQNNTSLNQYYFGIKYGTSSFHSSSNFSLTANTWNHLVVTIDSSGNYAIYVNNSVATSGSGFTGLNTTISNPVKIGRYSASSARYWNGKIDQVRIYSTALDSDQVSQLYNEKPCADTSNFKTVLYEGNSSTQYISNVGFAPDLVWLKRRTTTATDHVLMDTIREKYLISNKTNAEASYGSVFDFNHLGFDLNGNSSSFNLSGEDYVAWCWKGGGDAVSNTDGTITSQVSANTEAGFSIVKFNGYQSSGTTVGHGLNQTPELIITKNLDQTTSWPVWFDDAITMTSTTFTLEGSTKYLALNSTVAYIPYTFDRQFGGTLNGGSGDEMIAYCFHSVSGYSKIGSYEGTSGTVTVSDVGFKPSFVMIKNADDSADWVMLDNRRNTIDDRLNNWLKANSDAQETGAVSTAYITVNDNGFIVANTTSLGTNANGDTYIYMAFK